MMYNKPAAAPVAQQPAQTGNPVSNFLGGLSDDEKKFLAGTMANWGQGAKNYNIPQTPQHQFQRGNMGMLQGQQDPVQQRNNAMALMLQGQ